MSEPQNTFFWNNLPQLIVDDLPAEDRCCSICFAAYGTQITPEVKGECPVQLPCSHVFGLVCLKTWLTENNTCPICRRELFPPLAQSPCQVFAFPVPFTRELISLMRTEDRERSSEEEEEESNLARSQWNFEFYHREVSSLPIPTHSGEDYQEFVTYYQGEFRSDFSRELISVEQHYDLYNFFRRGRYFDNFGFDIIREGTGKPDMQIYLEMMHENVRWIDNCWRTRSGEPFFPPGWDGPFRAELLRGVEYVGSSQFEEEEEEEDEIVS